MRVCGKCPGKVMSGSYRFENGGADYAASAVTRKGLRAIALTRRNVERATAVMSPGDNVYPIVSIARRSELCRGCPVEIDG